MSLPEHQLRALVRLLDDDDPSTLAVVEATLLREGTTALPLLQHASEGGAESLAAQQRAREVLMRVRTGIADAQVLGLCSNEPFDWESAAWVLAEWGDPRADSVACCMQLDAWAERLRMKLTTDERRHSFNWALPAMVELLRDEEGFHGVPPDDVTTPEHSYVTSVMRHRTGLPIAMSAIWLMVARRAGIPLRGVGLPGHFVVGWGAPPIERFLAPALGCRVLTRDDCAAIARQYGTTLQSWMLDPIPARAMWARMVRNLWSLFVDREDTFAGEALARWHAMAVGTPE